MTKIVFEGKLDNINLEDGGMAAIADVDWKNVSGDDENIFVRLQSWDEDMFDHPDYDNSLSKYETFKLGHKTMQELSGKKIRIIVEVVE